MTEFKSNGYRINYTDSISESPANSPVLVFVHGLVSSSKVYAGQINYFRQKYRCIAFDLFGHGKSDSPLPDSVDPDFYSLSSYAKSLVDLLSHLSIERATLIGWSLGSAISITVALTYPHVIENLILVATTPVFFLPEGDDFPGFPHEEAKIFLNILKNDYHSFYEPFVLQQYPSVHPLPSYVEEAIHDAASVNPEVAYSVVSLSGNTDFRQTLHNIKARTLIISGVDDPFCRLLAAKWMSENIEDSNFISYDCGHVPFVGPYAERFSRDVAKFLEGGTD